MSWSSARRFVMTLLWCKECSLKAMKVLRYVKLLLAALTVSCRKYLFFTLSNNSFFDFYILILFIYFLAYNSNVIFLLIFFFFFHYSALTCWSEKKKICFNHLASILVVYKRITKTFCRLSFSIYSYEIGVKTSLFRRKMLN